LGGVLADRVPRRHILSGGRILFAAVVLVMALLVYSDVVAVWHVLVAAVMVGTVMAVSQAATQTYVSDIVGPQRLQNALALNSGMQSGFQMAGPVVGGFIIALGGVGLSYLVGGGVYFAALGALLLIPVLGAVSGKGEGKKSVLADVAEGLRYARQDRVVFWMLAFSATSILGGSQIALRPAIAKDILEVGSSGFGMMTTFAGIGSVIGAMVIAVFFKDLKWQGHALAGGIVLHEAFKIVYGFSESYPLTLAMEAGISFVGPIYIVITFTYIQTTAPEAIRGRIVSLIFTTFQLNSISALIAGLLADALSVPLAIFLMATTRIGIVALMFAVARPLRMMGRTPAPAT
jgi:MFS family permease